MIKKIKILLVALIGMLAMATYGCNNDETDMDPSFGDGNGNVNKKEQYVFPTPEDIANLSCTQESYVDSIVRQYDIYIVGKWKLMLSYEGEPVPDNLIDHSCDDIFIDFNICSCIW